ncbi:helix-turn-helix transcriptional regulator [Acinetobacter sp. B5B]|uniref:ArsR/SmtB family transcription factor n=1 Tax=Acinetobacter baretiae TaxID=2605383 RepID=UPI0018C26299|nr:winged helix-turn-helix transcriptional regulator [Acinetobacter baretiae]MBF7682275.1 helix-turn-helix transcriptional regulator [Acinetobacter baretiae]MBF7685103.1 helix-turn-helix transcriptional regulator [Acinetobacter baretiae]
MANLDEMFQDAVKATNFLKMISNPQRLLMICAVMKKPGLTNGEISTECGLSISATSQHLTKMCMEGILYKEKDAQMSRYYVKEKTTEEIVWSLKRAFSNE